MADEQHTIISRADATAAGLKWYFTGEPCKRGHIAQRMVSNQTCRICGAARRKAFYYRNREQEIGKVKAYYVANRTSIRARAVAYDAANKAKKSATFKRWYEANKPAYLEKKARERRENPELFVLRYKKWANANHEHVVANNRRRTARKKNAPGHHTGKQIKALYRQQKGKCVYCRVSLAKSYHADHIVAITKGGSNDISNIQLTCADCNRRKSNKDPIYWAKEIGLLL